MKSTFLSAGRRQGGVIDHQHDILLYGMY